MQKILVTGAGGFIGGRLVEVLKEQQKDVHVLLRTIYKGARISPYPVHYFQGDITNKAAIEAALEGCDALVHCAHDFAKPEDNLLAANIIAELCIQKKIKKLVYISSFAIHRTDLEDTINELSPMNPEWDYGVNKAEVEKRFQQYHQESGLPVVILRPTIVYGPFAGSWTLSVVSQMLENRLVIPYEGKRWCNAVYVDDVVHAIIRALDADEICNGQAYLISGPQAVMWHEFYTAYKQYPGVQDIVTMNEEDSDQFYKRLRLEPAVEVKAKMRKDPISFLKKTMVYNMYQRLLTNDLFRKRLLAAKKNIPRPLIYPGKDLFELLACKSVVDLKKIEEELKYKPSFSFDVGMKHTIAYLKWANLNCD